MKTFIIAEIGSAWRGIYCERNEAYHAILLAKSCGADAIKFQWTSDPRKMEQRRNVQPGSYDILSWPDYYIPGFAQECRERQIEFMCTVFLPEDVAMLNPYVKRWKVASLEADAQDLRLEMAATNKPIIQSAGANTFMASSSRYSTLHCTAAYPAPLSELNLRAIGDNAVGYSDHSRNTLTGAVAVACGATIIEVHFKLFKTPIDNPDYDHSLYENALREYIANIRKAELMLGDGIKKVEASEQWALKHKVRT
jgi:N,N'-diacetyllegionaminate synthase